MKGFSLMSTLIAKKVTLPLPGLFMLVSLLNEYVSLLFYLHLKAFFSTSLDRFQSFFACLFSGPSLLMHALDALSHSFSLALRVFISHLLEQKL